VAKQENLELLTRALARYNARDLEGYLGLYDRAVIFHGFGRLKPGISGLREHFAHLWQAFPDVRTASEDLIADEEKIAHRYTFYGTHLGEYMGIAPSKKMIVVPGQIIHLFRGAKCVEVWQSVDNLSFLTQIGALPAFSRPR
jgi:predicted ester cyclase